jgi:hypothetical protein
LASASVVAGGVYQEPEDFINEIFDHKPPKAEALWLNNYLKKQITDILDQHIQPA